MNWYLKVIHQYFDFTGRARRKEYWMFTLINILISWLLPLIDFILGTFYFTTISYIYSILIFIPALAVLLRRLHDVGKSGWYFFLILIPFIGWLWLLILLCMDSVPRPNIWGDNPKGIGNDRMINQIGKE